MSDLRKISSDFLRKVSNRTIIKLLRLADKGDSEVIWSVLSCLVYLGTIRRNHKSLSNQVLVAAKGLITETEQFFLFSQVFHFMQHFERI